MVLEIVYLKVLKKILQYKYFYIIFIIIIIIISLIRINISNIKHSDLLDDEDIIDVTSSEVPRLREVLEFFLSLEPNDINWIDYLKNSIDSHSCSLDWMKEFEDNNPEIMNYLKNISIYFVWRYFLKGVFDGEILSKMKFMAVSILIVKFLFYCTWQDTGSLSLDECVSIVRRYSEEVEYSDDNMLAFAEASYDNDFFSVENLLAL